MSNSSQEKEEINQLTPRCERCHEPAGVLYDNYREDPETGEKKKWKLCSRCDWEMMNDWASEDEDLGEMNLRRQEEDYEYDPINCSPPGYDDEVDW